MTRGGGRPAARHAGGAPGGFPATAALLAGLAALAAVVATAERPQLTE